MKFDCYFISTEKVTEDSDVNPKRLTLAALDVARGLSYLASVNYVHRGNVFNTFQGKPSTLPMIPIN